MDRRDIQRLALQGWGEVRIARELGLTRGRTRVALRWLRDFNRLPPARPGATRAPSAAARDELARDLRHSGHTLAEISQALGCGTGTVARAVRGIAVDGRARRTAAVAERRADVAALSEQGSTTAEVAAELGVAPHTVREDIRALSTDDRHHDRRIKRAERVAAAHTLALTGMPVHEVAAELQVTVRTVRLYLGPVGRETHCGTRALSAGVAAYRRRVARGMRDAGALQKEIADRLGVSVTSVASLLRGAPPRPRSKG